MIVRVALALVALALVGGHGGDARGESGAVSASVRVNPLVVSVSLSETQIDLGGLTTATATVTNAGADARSGVHLTLRLDPSGLAVEGGDARTIASLPGHGSASESWHLCALAPGGYVVMVRAEVDGFAADSPAQLLDVGSSVAGSCPEDTSAVLSPGETLTTDTEGDGATPADPLETSVTSPSGGEVSITEEATTSTAASGLVVLGQQVQISAPPESAGNPIVITFLIDSSLIPAGVEPLSIEVFRNGLAVAACTGAPGIAEPDPCLESRAIVGDDLQLVVLTSTASTWTFGTVYPFEGFFPPVANPPTLNAVRAGQSVPVKFSLGGDRGLAILASGFPASRRVACDTGVQESEVEETVTSGASTLSYDATSDQYTYVWKTDSSWAGTCRELVVRLVDGTDHRARFRLR